MAAILTRSIETHAVISVLEFQSYFQFQVSFYTQYDDMKLKIKFKLCNKKKLFEKTFYYVFFLIYFLCKILTSKVYPRTVRVNIFLMVVDPYHRYSNELERDQDH